MKLLPKQMTVEHFMKVAAQGDDLKDHDPRDITALAAIEGTALINWCAGVLDALNGPYLSVPAGTKPFEVIAVVRDFLDAHEITGGKMDKPMITYMVMALTMRWTRLPDE